MKLTKEKLKNLILEELKSLHEEEPTPEQGAQAAPQAAKPEDAKQKIVASTSKLGDEFIEVGRAIKASKVKGLDTSEIPLLSKLMADMLALASQKSAKSLLVRLEQLIAKQL